MRETRAQQPRVLLRLYVAGNAPNSVLAIANLRAIFDDRYPCCYTLEIVDMLKEPLRALADEVIVTPTLLWLLPLPSRRVIGNMSDTSRVLSSLGSR